MIVKSVGDILEGISEDEVEEFEEKWEGMLKVWKRNDSNSENKRFARKIWNDVKVLISLGISVGVCVIVFKFVFFLGF